MEGLRDLKNEEVKNLRKYFNLFSQLKRDVEKSIHPSGPGCVDGSLVEVMNYQIDKFKNQFPDLLFPFNLDSFFYFKDGYGKKQYRKDGILGYLSTAISELEAQVSTTEPTPFFEKKDFSFVKNVKIREILERDYLEIGGAFVSRCWKSAIILSGGSIEALLLYFLLTDENLARSAKNAPSEKNLNKWNLQNLIDVAVELNSELEGVKKLSHSVREYRNLIHPGKEVDENLKVAEEEARIAVEVLHMVHRELSK